MSVQYSLTDLSVIFGFEMNAVIEEDSEWYVRKPGNNKLSLVKINAVTQHTVTLIDIGAMTPKEEQYKINDICFVEELENDK